MSEHPSSSPFINSANSQMYGKMPLESWVGKVVSFDALTGKFTGYGSPEESQ